jgi:hypothetical protein
VSFLTAPEWTSSCQSSGFAGILPFATHPPALAVSGKRVAPAQVGRQSDKDNIVQSMVAMP